METFLNISIDQPTRNIFIKKHLLYSLLWLLNISIFILRLDSYIAENNFIRTAIPFILVVCNFLLLFKQKWYYNLAFLFYPFLVMLWFVPKFILEKGKLYLLLYYLEVILGYLTKFKKSIIKSTILFSVLIVLCTIDNKYIRMLALLYFSYLFIKNLQNYIIGSFNKSNKQSNNTKGSLSKFDLVDTLEKIKDNEKLSTEQNLSNKIERMILWNYFLEYFSNNVNGYRGKKAFMIVWFFKYFFFFFLTISFFTFFNYQLYKIAPSNFISTSSPNLFDFIYYTFKNVTFSSIDNLKPNSVIAKIIEMSSFFILAIYFLIITISSILSFKMSEYSKDVEEAIGLCKMQNEKIELHLKLKYNTDVSKALSEVDNIKLSIFKLKGILEKIL